MSDGKARVIRQEQQDNDSKLLGQVLEKVSRMEGELARVLEAQREDDTDRARRSGVAKVSQIVMGFLFTAVVGISGYYGSMVQSHEGRIAALEQQVQTLRTDLDRHSEGPGHDPTRNAVAEIRGDLQELSATVRSSTQTQTQAIADLRRSVENMR